jgi:hypothetical protein
MATPNVDNEYEIIFVASYVDKRTGKRVYAKTYGKKAFPIRVKRKGK